MIPSRDSTKINSKKLQNNERSELDRASDARTRRILAYAITLLVTAIAITTTVWPSASGVFSQVLPLLTLVLGYFFGTQTKG